nr:recombinase family protein [Chamaesiphon sp. VAR_48_metabat_403]
MSVATTTSYARVSSSGQSLDVQLDKLKHCDKIDRETQSGTNQQRSQLAACLEYVRDGDTIDLLRKCFSYPLTPTISSIFN